MKVKQKVQRMLESGLYQFVLDGITILPRLRVRALMDEFTSVRIVLPNVAVVTISQEESSEG